MCKNKWINQLNVYIYIYNIYIWNNPKRNQPCLVLYWIRAFVWAPCYGMFTAQKCPSHTLPRRWCTKHGCIWQQPRPRVETRFFLGGNRRGKLIPEWWGWLFYTFLIFVCICILLGDANLRNRGGLCLAIRQELQEPWIGIFWRLPVHAGSCAPRCSRAQNESSSSA